MGKPEFDWNHPLIVAGLWPDQLITEVMPYEDVYQWAKKHEIPYRNVKGTYWIHKDFVIDWVRRGDQRKPGDNS